ncbi:peptide/nickel transport system permease protein [Paenibacillus sp. yr247]|uniref:ABC transporter permease n=1 Tax=Paenibacillus sp. yr247 TaxID=1761880 RepID=UPI000891A67A|nr:ABC transporter permease [Paenibacillus sp. yr247]SDN94563.1 peptide/nickel transport system permease protein [Paenibacillus sp. yr247]
MHTFRSRFFQNKTAVVTSAFLLLICLGALFAPFLVKFGPNVMANESQLIGSGNGHIMGTDQFGRDMFSRVLYGARVSIWVGISSVALSAVVGTLLGLVAGFFGKRIDTIIMRVMDVFFAFPEILLALAIVATFGPGTSKTILAIAIVYVPVFTRTVRGAVLSVKHLEYVESSVAIGAGTWRILTKDILPNINAPLIVQATMAISGAILTESALSFLGLGIQPPNPSWGGMISEARRYMELAPWMIVWPVAVMTATILAFNLFGDAIRDLLDPRHQGR